MKRIGKEAARFLLAGGTTVVVDFTGYSLTLSAGVATPVAKALGFVGGMVFAWFAHRWFTFSIHRERHSVAGFAALYLGTLALNVGVNQLSLALLGSLPFATAMAFVAATGSSAAANFLGMKFLVFKPADR